MRGVPDQLGAEGLWPTWRYWAGVLVGLPALLVPAVVPQRLSASTDQDRRVRPADRHP
jgi:hypothetical protein